MRVARSVQSSTIYHQLLTLSAIAFGYFETLVYLRDGNKFYEELARLRSLSNVCNQAGFDLALYEDFADETYDLLKKLPDALAVGNAEEVLYQTFSDEMVQNYIITHLRVCGSLRVRACEDGR